MSLQGINNLVEDWNLNNTLTIVNDVDVEGDLDTTGFIYDGGVPFSIGALNNVWTNTNQFVNSLPTYLNPTTNNEMNTKDYMDTEFLNIGSSLLPLNNVWTGMNTMNELPTISSNASAGNECVNKVTSDTLINATTGNLTANNVWTGLNDFQNTLTLITPTDDLHIANKVYVDNAITAFNNAGGKVEYVEINATGNTNVTCDPATYSSMYVCMVSGGGFGVFVPPEVPAQQKIYGGSGAFVVFKLTAYTGNAVLNQTNSTTTLVGSSSFVLPNGSTIVTMTGGGIGTQAGSGIGGTATWGTGIKGSQYVSGSSRPLSVDGSDPVDRVPNVAVWNGFGVGGRYDSISNTSIVPTGAYTLLIKFKN